MTNTNPESPAPAPAPAPEIIGQHLNDLIITLTELALLPFNPAKPQPIYLAGKLMGLYAGDRTEAQNREIMRTARLGLGDGEAYETWRAGWHAGLWHARNPNLSAGDRTPPQTIDDELAIRDIGGRA